MSAPALEDLLAKEEIRERLHDYVRAMDRIDDELGRSVFHPDASADYGDIYRGSGHGFIAWVHAAHAAMIVHAHHLGSIAIKVDRERAVSETYVSVTLRMADPTGGWLDSRASGRYLDRWEKRAGRWAIAARHYVHEFDDLAPVTNWQFASAGRRDREDPSYVLFAGLSGG